MHDIAGLVALAVMGLWIAYLVPHRLRYRQQLLESRTEDRFSDALRVLAVADARRHRGAAQARAAQVPAQCGPDSPKRSGLLSPARGVPVTGRPAVTERRGVVERPYGTQDRISAEEARRVAQERARRAVTLARRAAAARRRAVLTAVLLVASVAAWVVVGMTTAAVTVAVVPTVLLIGVLGLGRRAVVQGRAADAAWERRQHQLQQPRGARPARVIGRALHPSDRHTEAIAQVGGGSSRAGAAAPAHNAASGPETPTAAEHASADDDGAERAPDAAGLTDAAVDAHPRLDGTPVAADAPPTEARADAAADAPAEGWSPVPVPRPTYTTKATAPRREPLPLVVDETPAAVADVATPATSDDAAPVAESDAAAAPTLDLDAILARRRAAGE